MRVGCCDAASGDADEYGRHHWMLLQRGAGRERDAGEKGGERLHLVTPLQQFRWAERYASQYQNASPSIDSLDRISCDTMKRLTELRNRAGLTQRQLALKAKVRQASICNWEQGIEQPTVLSLRKLAKALKTSLSELL